MTQKIFLLLFCFLFILGCKPNLTLEDKTILHGNNTWEGIVLLKGDITIESSAKLTIKPGTKILFDIIHSEKEISDDEISKLGPYSPQAELIVNGSIEAIGTKENPIIFTSISKEKAQAKEWGSINILGSDFSSFAYCNISGAYMGIHAHSSTVSIENCEFKNNYYGVKMKQAIEIDKPCMVNITNSIFENNHTGISIRNAINRTTNNIIRNNNIGIWLKEEVTAKITNNIISENNRGIFVSNASKTSISNNNIFNNHQYNISLGEGQSENIDAPNNWWGTAEFNEINKKIQDKNWDSTLGNIYYIPILFKPAILHTP